MLKKLISFFKPKPLLTIGRPAVPLAQPPAPDPNAGWTMNDDPGERPVRFAFERTARIYPGDAGALERQKAQSGFESIQSIEQATPDSSSQPRQPRFAPWRITRGRQ